jgi:hypothetical protein
VPKPVPEPEPIVPKPVPEPEPIVPTPEPFPEPEPQVEQEPEPQPAAAASTDRAEEPEVVVVPELQPAGEESASDLLDRLVEPVGAHDPSDDAGDLRARLARTAAIKKPGSKERREADEKQYRH